PEHHQRPHAGNQHAQRKIDEAEAQRLVDIKGVDVAVVDAEHHDQHDLGHEQQAEKEGEPAQRLLSALLERLVVDLVDRGPERIERRQHDDRDQDRINPEMGVDDIGDVGAENDEGGMRDVDDVEDPERDRDPDGHRDVESAEQYSRDDGVDQKVGAH